MPNATSLMVKQRVLAYAPAHPGQGPDGISAELAREKWGGIKLSTKGCGGCCVATACRDGPPAWLWSSATPRPPSPPVPSPLPSPSESGPAR